MAAKGIYEGLSAVDGKADGSELAHRKTRSTACTDFFVHSRYVFASKEKLKIVAIADHGKAVGAVAVADGADKRSLEGPDGMDESLFFKGSMKLEGFVMGETLEDIYMRTGPEGFQKGLLESENLLRIEAQPYAVGGIVVSRGVLAADAGHSDNRIGQAHYLCHILDRHDLSEVVPPVTGFMEAIEDLS
jgi:hypothetical protein